MRVKRVSSVLKPKAPAAPPKKSASPRWDALRGRQAGEMHSAGMSVNEFDFAGDTTGASSRELERLLEKQYKERAAFMKKLAAARASAKPGKSSKK